MPSIRQYNNGVPFQFLLPSDAIPIDRIGIGTGFVLAPSLEEGADFSTIAGLRASAAPFTGGNAIVVSAYSTVGDDGGGVFVYVATDTTTADNGVTIFVDTLGQRWYRQFVGPLYVAYGGANSTLTDCTAIFNVCHTIALAIGTGVALGPGPYNIAGQILAKARMSGQGIGVTNISVTSTTGDVVVYQNNGVEVCDMTMTATLTRTSGYFVDTNGTSYAAVRRINMLGWYGGILVSGGAAQNLQIESVFMTSTAPGAQGGVLVSGSGNSVIMTIRDVLVAGGVSPPNQPGFGFGIVNVGDLTLEHCSTVQCGVGLNVSPNTGQTVQLLIVNDCVFDTSHLSNVELNPLGTGQIQLFKSVNMWACSSVTADGVTIGTSSSGEVLRAEFINPSFGNNLAGSGLNLNNAAVAASVLVVGGNMAQNVHGAVVAAGCTGFDLFDVNFGPAGQWGINSGFDILTGANCDQFHIQGCVARAAPGGTAIGTLPGTPGQTYYIKDNRGGLVTQFDGVTNLTASGATTVIAHGLPAAPRQQDIIVWPTGSSGLGAAAWVSVETITSTTFTAVTNANPGSGAQVGWRATVWGGG